VRNRRHLSSWSHSYHDRWSRLARCRDIVAARNAFSGRTALLPVRRRPAVASAEMRPSIPRSDHWLTHAGLVVLYIMRWLVWYTAGRVCVCPRPGSVAAREPLDRSRCSSTVGMLSTMHVHCRACPSDSPASLCSGSVLSVCQACLLAGAHARIFRLADRTAPARRGE